MKIRFLALQLLPLLAPLQATGEPFKVVCVKAQVSDDKKNVVWGSKRNVVWGSSTTEGFNTIWESSVNQSDGTNFAPESLGLLINGEN